MGKWNANCDMNGAEKKKHCLGNYSTYVVFGQLL